MQNWRPTRFSWAVVQPSAVQTVQYLHPDLSGTVSCQIRCRQYLALVAEMPPNSFGKWWWYAFLVEGANRTPLPRFHLPIQPCNLGPREPLDPGFAWPFDGCVLNTGDFAPVVGKFVPSIVDTASSPHVLSETETARFIPLFLADQTTIIEMRQADEFSDRKSSPIPCLPGLGQLGQKGITIAATVSYDLSAVDLDGLGYSEGLDCRSHRNIPVGAIVYIFPSTCD